MLSLDLAQNQFFFKQSFFVAFKLLIIKQYCPIRPGDRLPSPTNFFLLYVTNVQTKMF